MDFEKKLSRLEALVEAMEGGKLSLEESLKTFEEGVKLSRECTQQLSEADKKVQILLNVDDEGNPVTKDF